jgi:UDP-glucose/iron transport system ATP-binding protein
MRSILETDKLTRVVGGSAIVSEITVQVDTGELVVVVGPSGSGKSSFLRLLNRLDEPTRGTVHFEGVDYRQIPPRELRCKIGMVTQHPFLFPTTVADNVRFGPQQRGHRLHDDEVEQLLTYMGLPGFGGRAAASLSGGEAQRVSLARALANVPKVLLLDEPTSALDQEAKAGIESLIKRIVDEDQLTCVMVTHDVAQATRIADRVMTIEAGQMRKVGKASEVLHA